MKSILKPISRFARRRALITSTLSFTVCFAVWTIFSIIGIKIKSELSLNDTEFGLLVATPILMGSVSRVFLGVLTDRYGGRIIFTLLMLIASMMVWCLTYVSSYIGYLVIALGVGLSGGSFAVGIAYVSRWYPRRLQGTALGIFGVGNVGAAVTNFGAPFLLVALGWQGVARVYAIILFLTAVLFWMFTKTDPVIAHRRHNKIKPPGLWQELSPLKKIQVWRFSLYYFFVFGAFVALALWLPIYYTEVYHLGIKEAGMLAAMYALPASLFRALGGWLSDKVGARTIMYWTFVACVIISFLLSYPATEYIVRGVEAKSFHFTLAMGLTPFVCFTIILGFFMSLGKAAVYKHIPVYYPENVGAVGGVVGMVGGLGGFFLPIAFGVMNDLTGLWTSCFMLLFLLVSIALTWMHFAILRMEKKISPPSESSKYFPEFGGSHVHYNNIPDKAQKHFEA
jgi:NNP family nitrate/nitrite transporter-like MFS transporter